MLAIFAGLDAADRDILLEHAMNPPEPHATRIEALRLAMAIRCRPVGRLYTWKILKINLPMGGAHAS